MAYKVLTVLQSIFILICGISVLDLAVDFGFNNALFGADNALGLTSTSGWWNIFAFWGYCFLLVGLFQLIKGLTHKSD